MGDVQPGNQAQERPARYFPELTWRTWEDSFRLLLTNPATPDDDLPVCEMWPRYVTAIFGAIPTAESGLSDGRLWRWGLVSSRMRALAASWIGGYDPAKTEAGEEIRLFDRRYVLNGNKRVALLRLTHGHDFEIEAECL